MLQNWIFYSAPPPLNILQGISVKTMTNHEGRICIKTIFESILKHQNESARRCLLSLLPNFPKGPPPYKPLRPPPISRRCQLLKPGNETNEATTWLVSSWRRPIGQPFTGIPCKHFTHHRGKIGLQSVPRGPYNSFFNPIWDWQIWKKWGQIFLKW